MPLVDGSSEDQDLVVTGSEDMTLDCEDDTFSTSTQFCDRTGPMSPDHYSFSFTSSYSFSSSSSSSSSSLTSAGGEDSGMDMTCVCEGDKDTDYEVGWTECRTI